MPRVNPNADGEGDNQNRLDNNNSENNLDETSNTEEKEIDVSSRNFFDRLKSSILWSLGETSEGIRLDPCPAPTTP